MIRRTAALLLAFALALSSAAAAPKKSSSSSKRSSKKPAASAVKKPSVAEPFAVAADDGPPAIRGESCIVLDANTGRVIHEKNADQVRPVASTQKLLTGLIVAEEGGLDGMIRVQPSDTWAEPSKLYLKAGEVYPRYKMLQILLVKSMNDVARALARDNAGSVEEFAAKMNAKARSLGMSNSNFVNPNGLPAPGQYSTARDMSKVAMAAYRNRLIRGIVCMKSLRWNFNDGRSKVYENTNQVLKNFAPCNGMKTGYTIASGHCLISSGSHGGRDVICVVLGSNRQVWSDSYRLLSWAFTN